MNKKVICSVPGCNKLSGVMGYCVGHYHRVRNYGNVGSSKIREQKKRPLIEAFNEKYTYSESGCWLWNGSKHKNTGYAQITINGKSLTASRVSYELFTGEIPQGMYVLHSCDVRHCVNPKHLFLGTQQNNIDDMMEKGRGPNGSKNGRSKLTEIKVDDIRSMIKSQIPIKDIAKKHGVSASTISMIKNGHTWGHRTA